MKSGCTLVLGMFDGVHIGHRALIYAAMKLGRKVAVYSFFNHPLEVVSSGDTKPSLLMTPQEKREKLMELGVDEVAMDIFDETYAKMTCRAYIESLVIRFAPKAVVAGFNHTFGAKGEGNAETLKELAKEFGFDANIVPPVILDGIPVSSTRVRELVDSGDMRSCSAMLGEPYFLTGRIEHNMGIGRKLGFPTANIPVPEKLLPPFGVYVTRAHLGGRVLPGVTNIGIKPSVTDEGRITIETHILGFEGDAYGRLLKIELLSMLRGERRFESLEQLKAQVGRDKAQALIEYKSF